MANTFVYNGFITEVKKSNITVRELNKIKRAILDIGNQPLKWLVFTGRVVPFNYRGKKLYMYRLNYKERLIFSIEDNKRIIYDIVGVNDIK